MGAAAVVRAAPRIVMTRVRLIQKLLRTFHLNVPERRQLDPPTIDFAELMAVVYQLVERDGVFSSGQMTLKKLANDQYRIHRFVPDPEAGSMWNDLAVVPVTDDYSSADTALRTFLRQLIGPAWGSPVSSIDGIWVIGCPVE
jgi:hypothetical protein